MAKREKDTSNPPRLLAMYRYVTHLTMTGVNQWLNRQMVHFGKTYTTSRSSP